MTPPEEFLSFFSSPEEKAEETKQESEEEKLTRELREVEARLTDLRNKQAEIEKKKLEEKKRLEEIERKKPFKLVASIGEPAGSTRVTIKQVPPKYNNDYVEMMRNLPSRHYHGEGEDSISIPEFQVFQDALNVLNLKRINNSEDGIALEFEAGAKEHIEKILNTPDYQVDISEDKKKLEIVISELVPSYQNKLRYFEGLQVNYRTNRYFLPIVEGYRLWNEMTKWPKVSWSDEAKEHVLKDLELRSKLEKIWDTEETSLAMELNGYKLRNFQNQTVEYLDLVDGRAIVAHAPGLGKTICSVAYKEYKKIPHALVIVPSAIKYNWARHIANYTGTKPMMLSGATPKEFDMVMLMYKKAPYTIISYDTIATRKEVVEKNEQGLKKITERWYWVDLINAAKFDLVIVDESHRIKNTDSNRSQAVRMLHAPKIIHLTGTPILNRPGELYAPLSMLSPDEFPSEANFLATYTHDGKKARNVESLRKTLKRLMFRRTKKEVYKDLPPIERIYDYHELSERYRKVYEYIMAGIYKTLDRAGNEVDSKVINSILTQILRAKQVCAMDKMDRVAELAIELSDASAEEENNKVIIFSQFKRTVTGIAQRLGNEVVTITGDITDFQDRQKIVDQFQTDPKIKFLVGTQQTIGEGLDMTKAGYVIFNDLFWTPAAHQQCEDRAYGRMSDIHPVESYYVVAENTIENWIQELLAAKLKIIEDVIDGVSDPNESIANDLIKKIREARG